MSDIFRKVKNIFTNLKSFITANEDENKDPHDKLIEKFSSSRPLDVCDLDGVKQLCKQISEEGAQESIDIKFDILKDLMLQKVVDATCKSQLTVDDKKVRNKKEYKEFIKKEFKRMSNDELEEDKKEVKRIKTSNYDFKNEISWGILPDKWRFVRESSKIDIVEFALHNDDEAKGPILFIGDVPADLEESYFNEEYISSFYKRTKPSNIICDLYNPDTNCRKCIRYEFNQERQRQSKEEQKQNILKDEELYETIKGKSGLKTENLNKLIKRTNNLEDKVWLSFLFNKNFKFNELTDTEKNLFFDKLKKSGVLCMEALEKMESNQINDKTIENAIKRELFDIKENVNDVFQGSVFEPTEAKEKHVTFVENNEAYKGPVVLEDHADATKIEGAFEAKSDLEGVFNVSKAEDLTHNRLIELGEKPATKSNEMIENNNENTEESQQVNEGPKINFPSFSLPKAFLPPAESKENPFSAGLSLNLPPPTFDKKEIGLNEQKTNIFQDTPLQDKNEAENKIPESWHFTPKYPIETNKDQSINPFKPIETHPTVFNRKEPNESTIASFMPIQNGSTNLNMPTGPFSFTPSKVSVGLNPNNPTSSTPLSQDSPAISTPFNQASPASSPKDGPSKRKIASNNVFQNNASLFKFENLTASASQAPPMGQSMLQIPCPNNNLELNKFMNVQQTNIPFLGEVPNPFETSNPLQHTRNDNLKFVDNTFKYNDIFNKSNTNIFSNSKSMFDDLIFNEQNNGDQSSNVRYINPDTKNNNSGNIFGSNLFGDDNDPWSK